MEQIALEQIAVEQIMETKQSPIDQAKQCAAKFVTEQQEKSVGLLTYLVEAQREVLEFELTVLEDVLRILKKKDTPRQG